jgi:uncharacterized membrane protein
LHGLVGSDVMFCRGDHKRLIKSLIGANYRLKKKGKRIRKAGLGRKWRAMDHKCTHQNFFIKNSNGQLGKDSYNIRVVLM